MAYTLSHPAIGSIKASTAQEGVVQFLGLQYATLKDRFAPPVLQQYVGGTELDATKYGPSCLTFPNGEDMEQALMQHELPYDRSLTRMSDTEGLTLNLTVPRSHVSASSAKLPVMIFLHGGGMMAGCSRFPQYDMTRLVRLSETNGMPIIAASANYRLGAPGMLHSQEMRSAGYLPNNNLRDQRAALEWIQKYISGFGGDPDRVTLVGESAGAVSADLQLYSQKPLFKRVMCMSGTSLLLSPATPQSAEESYRKAVKALGLESTAPTERVKALTEIDMNDLRDKIAGATGVTLLLDPDTCPSTPRFEDLAKGDVKISGKQWCEAMIMGDCEFDGGIMVRAVSARKAGVGDAFATSVKETLKDLPELASGLLSKYGIGPDIPDDDALIRILECATDSLWYAPTFSIAQAVSDSMPVFMYRCNAPNPWPGMWHGKASHIHDLVLLLQNFSEFLPEEQREAGVKFAKNVISFVNGMDPWTRWQTDEGKSTLLLDNKANVNEVPDKPETTARRAHLFELADQAGLDRVKEAVEKFLFAA